MGVEPEPNAVVENPKQMNKLDEDYGYVCLSISKDIIFHLNGLKTPKEVWEQLSKLFGKKYDMRDFQLENELISINPRNFETINEFFTKFKHLMLQMK